MRKLSRNRHVQETHDRGEPQTASSTYSSTGRALSIGILVMLGTSQSALGQSLPKPPKPDSCKIVKPWTAAGGELVGAKAASATYQRLETRWSVDTAATIRELSAFLSNNPQLVGAISAADDACPRGGCVCPKPPKLPQTASIGQYTTLSSAYRADSGGTSAATAIFLAKHSWLVNKIADSLSRYGTPQQKMMFRTAANDVRTLQVRVP